MSINPEILEVLICPQCDGALNDLSQKNILFCETCKLYYPIQEGVPLLIEEQAFDHLKEGMSMGAQKKSPLAIFTIEQGPNQGEVVKLPLNHCRAIGRSVEDLNKTQLFQMDATIPLDDFTKKLVMNYLAKKTGKNSGSKSVEEGLGGFKRLADLVLSDPAVSRMHAMLFYDESGAGVLDFVSRNGTYVNGQEVESFSLKEGDLLEVGATKIHFSFGY